MKVKAVIWRTDRTNDVVVVKKKDIQGKAFRHGNYTYFLDSDRFMVTWIRKMGFRKYYSTYYYAEGISYPVPVPDFQATEVAARDEKGEPILDKDGKPVLIKVFPEMVKGGIESEELASIFNPWFYRIIASLQKDAMSQIQFYLVIGILCAVGYIIFKLHNLSVDDISGLRELYNAIPIPSQSPPSQPVNTAAGG